MKDIENSLLIQNLNFVFKNQIISVEISTDFLTLVIASESVKEIIAYLKEKQNFIFLTDICGIHYPEQEKELGVIYHLHNLVANMRLRVKTFVSKEKPQVDSIESIFSAANWMERETFDFYGIDFVGHPNLKRILNVEYMDYFPMRKEYPLEDATRTDKNDSFFGR